jgi:guanylate kinase
MLPEKERNELFVVLLDVSAKEQEKRIIERGSYEEAELKRRIAADYEDFYDFNEYHIKINTDLLKPSEIAKILIGINE